MRHLCSEIGEWLYCHDAVHKVYIGSGDAAMLPFEGCLHTATYVGYTGTRIGYTGTCFEYTGTLVGSARIFGYQHVGICNAKLS